MEKINVEENFKTNNNLISNYVKEILSMNNCKAFIKCSFVNLDNVLKINYELDRLYKFDIKKLRSPYELLDYIEKTFTAVKIGINYWISDDKYELDCDFTYFDAKNDDIKIKFIPKSCSKQNNKIEFLKSLESIITEKIDREYVIKLKNVIEEKNLSYVSIINYIGELKREICICGLENTIYIRE